MAEYPKRKRIRLADYDYGSPGAYFVTVCTHEKRCVFSRISVGEGLAPPVVQLTEIGAIVEGQILDLARRYPALVIDRFVIMPNHVHLLITLTGSQTAGGAYP